MTVVYPPPLVQHVFCFSGFGIGGVVGIDVGADVGEEVGSVAGVVYREAEAGELAPVVEEDFPMPREIILF